MRAVVDIGSNSVKFAAASQQRGAPDWLEKLKFGSKVTRLGKGIHKTQRFDPESFSKTVEALEWIFLELTRLGAKKISFCVVGTSAVRDAQDKDRLAAEVQRIFKVPLQVLSGLEEAQLSLSGAQIAGEKALKAPGPFAFFEVGGASSQVGMLKPKFLGHSFQAGAVRCHEHLGLDAIPVDDHAWQKAQQDISRFFPESEWRRLEEQGGSQLKKAPAIAIGGSLLLAARLAGARKINDLGFESSKTELENFNNQMRKISLDERLKLRGMESGRADILCAGILCLTHMLNCLKKEKVLITSWGLRHGILANWDEVYGRTSYPFHNH